MLHKVAHWSPCSVGSVKPVRSHLVGHAEQRLTKRRTALVDCARPSHGGESVGREGADPSRRLAPPRPPLRSGPLPLWAEASLSAAGLRPLAFPLQRSVRRGRLVQLLGRDEGLPVLLLADGKHGHADVVALAREVAPLPRLAALNLTLAGGRWDRAGFWRGGLGVRSPGGFSGLRGPGEEAEAGPREAGAAQVAGGVEAPLPLGGLRKRVGGIADRRVGVAALVPLGVQVNVREDSPSVLPSAVSHQTGRNLEHDMRLRNWSISTLLHPQYDKKIVLFEYNSKRQASVMSNQKKIICIICPHQPSHAIHGSVCGNIKRFRYWRCPPAWWRDCWSSSCTTSCAAVAEEGGSPGRCARSTLWAWHSRRRRPWETWRQRARWQSLARANRPQSWGRCRCDGETAPSAKKDHID